MARRRLDAELVRRGLAGSRTEAQRLIDAGRVTVAGAPGRKAATMVSPTESLRVTSADDWASRGAHKLLGALAATGVDPRGRVCLDAGASTGGFTDVLLRAGAASVTAVDVGYGQLQWRLRTDDRVVVLDRTNARHLTADLLPEGPPDLVVADLSFISLSLVLPALAAVAAPTADHLLMVKPQFEVGAGRVGKGGVVRNPQAWHDAVAAVVAAADDLGLGLLSAAPSPLPGPAGNVEFFVHLRAGARADAAVVVADAVARGQQLARGDS